MYRHMLLCVPPAADPPALASKARDLIDLGAETVTLTHIRSLDGDKTPDFKTSGASPDALDEQARALTSAGLPATPLLERYSNLAGLRDLAASESVDAVALAMAEDRALARFLPDRSAGKAARVLGRALVVLGLGQTRHAAPHPPAGILDRVLLPADFSVRAGCVVACLERVAKLGAGQVTLLHVADESIKGQHRDTCVGLDRVDLDWVDSLKDRLLRAGADQVCFEMSSAAQAVDRAVLGHFTLVVLSGHCNDDVLAAYRAVAARLAENDPLPTFMLPAGCAAKQRSA